jgi:hypothetical protein
MEVVAYGFTKGLNAIIRKTDHPYHRGKCETFQRFHCLLPAAHLPRCCLFAALPPPRFGT